MGNILGNGVQGACPWKEAQHQAKIKEMERHYEELNKLKHKYKLLEKRYKLLEEVLDNKIFEY